MSPRTRNLIITLIVLNAFVWLAAAARFATEQIQLVRGLF